MSKADKLAKAARGYGGAVVARRGRVIRDMAPGAAAFVFIGLSWDWYD